MGAVAGAIASGRVPAGGTAGDPGTSWINPTSIVGGVLAVAVCAYLSAVYLTWDAKRLGDAPMEAYFRRRAVGSRIAAGIALSGSSCSTPTPAYVFDGLTSRALPLVIVSGSAGSARCCSWCATPTTAPGCCRSAAVATVVVGWGVAQWPYLLPESLKVNQAAAPVARWRRCSWCSGSPP